MNIDDLFIANDSSVAERLRNDADSLVEPVVESLNDLDCPEFDTLMAISTSCDSQYIDHGYQYMQQQASTFGRMILDQFDCIDSRSIMALRTGMFDWFEVNHSRSIAFENDYYNIVFVFKRNFKSAREILRLMNVAYSHFQIGAHCFIEFHTMRTFGIMSEECLRFTYGYPHRDLYLRCKRKDGFVYAPGVFGDDYAALVNLVYKLLPPNSGIRPYERMCDYFQTSLFETDAAKFLLGKRGIKDYHNAVMSFKTGTDYLAEWDGRIPIDVLCNDDDESQLILMTPSTEEFTHKVSTSIAGTSNQSHSIRQFFHTIGAAYNDFKMNPSSTPWPTTQTITTTDFAYVRQFNIYYILSNEFAMSGTHTYMLLFRMKPQMIDSMPGEVVLSTIFQLREGGSGLFINVGSYRTQGELMRERLVTRLGIVLPESFIRKFDDNLEHVQSQQLKEQIRYHGREH